jgi:uncharacterized protein YjaG (DUF416 family)
MIDAHLQAHSVHAVSSTTIISFTQQSTKRKGEDNSKMHPQIQDRSDVLNAVYCVLQDTTD